MKISFHGAAGDVTGSCHLVEAAGRRILVDCGLFQGSRELHEENAEDFGFDPAAIDFLLLTHAHLDHCGRIPLLAKRGFRGEIITTAASRELARLVMLDSAHLQEEEARRRERAAARRGTNGSDGTAPLYSTVDTLGSLDRFGRTAVYGTTIELAPGLRATFRNAGHILGSASILLEAEENGRQRSVVLSGDIGNAGRPLLNPPDPPASADAVVMETTYGDRLHRPLDQSVNELFQSITDTFKRGGNVVIPTFALERAQEILFYLRQGVETNRLPASVQVFLDSPMAISATEIFRRHPEACTASEVHGKDPFGVPNLRLARDRSDSMAINQVRGGAVIMAGNGMATGGRVLHHLRHNLARPESGVIFVGYAARGTLARQIIDGAKRVRVFGEEIAVRASVCTIGGFSAHADQAELLAWHAAIRGTETTFLVHGEGKTMEVFAHKLPPGRIEIPKLHQQFEL